MNVLRAAISTWSGVAFSLVIVLVDWEQIRGRQFPDIPNYVYKIDAISWLGTDYFYLGETWIDYLKNEYAWFFILYLIAKSSLDPLLALKIISGISAFVYHRFLAAGIGNALAFVFLMNPITIDLLASQLRGAFAFSLFLAAVMLVRRQALILAGIPLFGLVHSAMFPLGCLYLVSRWLANLQTLGVKQKVLLAVGLAVVFAFLISEIAPLVTSAVGDRRNFEGVGNKSLLYVTFWLIWGGMLIVSARSRMDVDWVYLFAIVVCVSVPVMTVLAFPGFRFLALSLPIVFLGVLKFSPNLRIPAGAGVVLYQAALFYYWIG